MRLEAAKANGFKCIFLLGLSSSSYKLLSSCSSEGPKVTVLPGEVLLDLLEAEGEGEAVRRCTTTSSVDWDPVDPEDPAETPDPAEAMELASMLASMLLLSSILMVGICPLRSSSDQYRAIWAVISARLRAAAAASAEIFCLNVA